MARTRTWVEMNAALGSGSAPLPSLPQPRARASPLILGSGPSRFEATSQPSKGRPKTAVDLRANPLAGTLTLTLTLSLTRYPSPLNYHGFPKSCCTSVKPTLTFILALTLTLTLTLTLPLTPSPARTLLVPLTRTR